MKIKRTTTFNIYTNDSQNIEREKQVAEYIQYDFIYKKAKSQTKQRISYQWAIPIKKSK